MKKRPTIRDVAGKAGLAVSTVSLVINNKSNVSEKTRKRVQGVITDLGYHPHRGARGLASRESGNLGFILTEDHFSQAEPFYTKVFLGTEFEARKHNYYVLLTTVANSVKESTELPRFLLEQNVDGVLIAGRVSASWLDYIEELHLPVVLIDYQIPKKNVSTIAIDNRGGARLVVDHLRKGGHNKIGFVGGDISHPSIAERFSGYKDALSTFSLPFSESWSSIDEPDTRPSNGYNAAKKIFLNPQDTPTAIFAANDALAIGCIQYLKESRNDVPNEVAVVGFDNIEAGMHVDPRLTTVNVHKEELGALAVRRIVEMIREKNSVITRSVSPVELVVRESCGQQKELVVAD